VRWQPGRLVGIDAARGVALLGMMAIHVLPSTWVDGRQPLSHLLAHGRAAAAFALLAGVSLGLATRDLRASDARFAPTAAGVLARAAVIGTIGLALGSLDSGVAVILPYYAVFFALMTPLLRLPTPALVAVAVAAATVVPVASHAVRAGLPGAAYDNPTFAMLLERPVPLLRELLLTGYYPALPWLAYLAAGLVVSRLALHRVGVAVGLTVAGAALAAGAYATSWLAVEVLGGRAALAAAEGTTPASAELDEVLGSSHYGATPTDSWWWLAIAGPHSSTPFDLVGTTGTALALLGALLLVARASRWAVTPLAAAGSMTLTLYTAHVAANALAPLPADPLTDYAVQVVAVLAIGLVWRALFRRGPLEAAAAAAAAGARRAATGGDVAARPRR